VNLIQDCHASRFVVPQRITDVPTKNHVTILSLRSVTRSNLYSMVPREYMLLYTSISSVINIELMSKNVNILKINTAGNHK
jgi:hypothetical protein